MINASDTFIPEQNRRNTQQFVENAGETRLPCVADLMSDSGETRLPTATEQIGMKGNFDSVYTPGTNVGGSYIVNRILDTNGMQAQIYYVKKMGKEYVLKIYNNGWHPSDKILGFFNTENHPNLARIIDNGFFDNKYFEVYEYYALGTLEDKRKCNASYISKVVVPSINEGLHELHKNGIIHCDIKPGNIFCANDDKSVIIGDFGLCEFVNSDGKIIDVARGTPEYSPPVATLYDTAALSPAFDYGSFGLVLTRLATGHSLLANMSIGEIAMAWNRGLRVPTDIDIRLQTLINGLINKNEDERWGYKEVRRWCDGEFVNRRIRTPRTRRKREQQLQTMVYGRFDDRVQVVSTLHQLAEAIRQNWNQARTIVRRRETTDFVGQFDAELADSVNNLAKVYDDDEAVFRLLYMLENTEEIFFKDEFYSGVEELLNVVESNSDKEAINFITSGMFVYYLRRRNAEVRIVDKIDQIIKYSGGRDLMGIKALCYAIVQNKRLTIDDKIITSINDFIDYLSDISIEEIDRLLDSESVSAWLYAVGYGNRVNVMKSIKKEGEL